MQCTVRSLRWISPPTHPAAGTRLLTAWWGAGGRSVFPALRSPNWDSRLEPARAPLKVRRLETGTPRLPGKSGETPPVWRGGVVDGRRQQRLPWPAGLIGKRRPCRSGLFSSPAVPGALSSLSFPCGLFIIIAAVMKTTEPPKSWGALEKSGFLLAWTCAGSSRAHQQRLFHEHSGHARVSGATRDSRGFFSGGGHYGCCYRYTVCWKGRRLWGNRKKVEEVRER